MSRKGRSGCVGPSSAHCAMATTRTKTRAGAESEVDVKQVLVWKEVTYRILTGIAASACTTRVVRFVQRTRVRQQLHGAQSKGPKLIPYGRADIITGGADSSSRPTYFAPNRPDLFEALLSAALDRFALQSHQDHHARDHQRQPPRTLPACPVATGDRSARGRPSVPEGSVATLRSAPLRTATTLLLSQWCPPDQEQPFARTILPSPGRCRAVRSPQPEAAGPLPNHA